MLAVECRCRHERRRNAMSATVDLGEFRDGVRKLHKELAPVARAFSAVHDAALQDGALDRKFKELSAVAISVVTHCDGCAIWHLSAALEAGASRAEVVESIGIAILMGGGPANYSAAKAMRALDDLLPEAP
jgi:AhpD family alkylhydroperoxidase